MLLAIITALAGFVLGSHALADSAERPFQRGINITMLFSFPKESGWPPFHHPKADISDRELEALARAGLDFIRLPVDPTPFSDANPAQRQELLDDLTSFVERANRAGLAVMVAGFPTHSERAWRPQRAAHSYGSTFEDYAQWLEEIAATVSDASSPDGAAIQLMNEPQPICVAEHGMDWADYQMSLHTRVREVTDLPIVLTGGCWSSIDGLTQLARIPEDPNTLFDVHYYSPFTYTHQGATWATPILAYVGGLRFPPQETDPTTADEAVAQLVAKRHTGTAGEAGETAAEALAEVERYLMDAQWPEGIAKDFDQLAQWADGRGIARERIILGEFGAIRPPAETPEDVASRERYLRAVRGAAEAGGFGWAMWEYYAPFGLLHDDTTRELSTGTLLALGLNDKHLYGGGARYEQ